METVLDPEPYDVLAVELSSHQLHWSNSLALHSAVVLNLQPDHYEWHGGAQGYRDAKAKIYSGVEFSCVYNVADPETERMVEEADVVEGARAIGFTLGTPGLVHARRGRRPAGRPGVHRAAQGLRARAGQARRHPPGRAAQRGERAGRGRARPLVRRPRDRGPRRPARRDGRRAQDRARRRAWRHPRTSTTPRPPTRTPPTPRCGRTAARSRGRSKVVWIAGGQAKGTTFDDLVSAHRGRLRGAVLLGVDRRADRRSARPTRARGARHCRSPTARLGPWAGRRGGRLPGTARRRGPPRPGLRQLGHVLRLRRPGGRVRRGGTRAHRLTASGDRRGVRAGSETAWQH